MPKHKIDREALQGALENAVCSLQECWDHLRAAELLVDPDGNFEIEQEDTYDYIDGGLGDLVDEIIKRAKEADHAEG